MSRVSVEDTATSPYDRVLRAKRKQTQSNKTSGGMRGMDDSNLVSGAGNRTALPKRAYR